MTEINELLLNKKIKNKESSFIEYFKNNLSKYISKNHTIKYKGDQKRYNIDIIKSGKFDSEYSSKINSFNWVNFFSHAPSFFRTLAKYLKSEYDYILIDSRTGFADTSGICTMLLPERLVLIFAPTDQNLEGVIDVAKQAREYRIKSYDERTLAFYPLPSRIDSNNTTLRPLWFEKYSQAFKKFFIEAYSLNGCNLKYYFEKSSIRYIHD